MQFQPLTAAVTEPIHTPHSAMSHHSTMARRDSTFLSLTEEPAAMVPNAIRQLRPSNFLILAPVTSESYPAMPKRRSSVSSEKKEEDSPLLLPVQPMAIKTRRSTSVSSTSSDTTRRLRFLKLNPVHWGGDENEDDYAIEE